MAILQYADGTILFMQDSVEDVRNMKLLLYLFEQMSGLKINLQKNEVIMVMSDDERCNMFANILNYQGGTWPVKYLGVLLSSSRLHEEDWVPAEECMYT